MAANCHAEEPSVNCPRKPAAAVPTGRRSMMLRKSRSLFSALLALCVAWASHAADQSAPQKHFLWKVTGPKGTIYLLGTIHAGTADLYPLAPVIEDSFNHCDSLVEEIDITDQKDQNRAQDYVLRAGAYQNGDDVIDHLSSGTWTALAAYATTNKFGSNYTNLKPWVLGLLIDQLQAKSFGLDGEKGLDKHFANESVKLHKPIIALETADFQVKLLSSFPDKLQDQLLFASLVEAEKGAKMLNQILGAWKSGDAIAMDAMLTASVHDYPFVKPAVEKVLYERNDAMARKIAELLDGPKTYFVAVGAAHLVGDRGILEQLRRSKIYTVEQL
jgi:uncharacterized protein YbaP (TraB family)